MASRTSFVLIAFVTIFLVWSPLRAEPTVVLDGVEMHWEAGPHMLSIRQGPSVTAGSDGFIYALGGVVGYGLPEATNSCERYDESTGAWSSIAPMFEKRLLARAVTDPYGKIWVAAGYCLTGTTGSVERYDPSSNTWTQMSGHLNTPRANFGMATIGGYIYVFGGHSGLPWSDPGAALSSVERCDLATGQWEYVAPMNEARYGVGFGVDSQGFIYAIGGGTIPLLNDVCSKTVERYDPSTNTWGYVADMPQRAGSPASFTMDGKIFTVGGGREATYFTTDCYVYSPATNTWAIGPDMYEPLNSAGAAVGPSGTAYVLGGQGPEVYAKDRVAMLVSQPIPEPFSLAFMGSAFVGVVAIRLRKWRKGKKAQHMD
jgi:hypothetical protein